MLLGGAGFGLISGGLARLGTTLLRPFSAVASLLKIIPGLGPSTKPPIRTSPKGVPVQTKADKPVKQNI